MLMQLISNILLLGNYTVKMTVTDKDGASNSTLAFVEVIEETDYPPTANAGEDKIVYLPQKVSSEKFQGFF